MPQSLEALESLLLLHGGGNPPAITNDPQKRHSIRAIIEVTLGQFIGFFVAVWCIFRSVDSMFAPRYRPHDDSFVHVAPAVVQQNQQTSSRSSVNNNGSSSLSSANNSKNDSSDVKSNKSTQKRSVWSSSRNSKSTKQSDSDKHIWAAPRSYSCKIVDIRSKQTGTAIARLGSSKKTSSRLDSNGELRRRLIEFTIETRSKPLERFLEALKNGNTGDVFNSTAVGEDPALVMASGFHQMGLGNANPGQKGGDANEAHTSILTAKVIRRQTDCEVFRSQVLDGAVPLDDITRKSCRSIFSSEEEDKSASGSSTSLSGDLGTGGSTGRRRYLGFSASSSSNNSGGGSELDLSSEVNLCSQLESVLNLLLNMYATRQEHPHSILCDFLGISTHATKSHTNQATKKSSTNGLDSDSDNSNDDAVRDRQLKGKKDRSHHHHRSGKDRRDEEVSHAHENNIQTSGTNGASSMTSNHASVDSLKSMEERASMMPAGVNIPLPPKSEWPDYPVLVRCSEDTDMKIGLGGNVSAYGALPINNAAQPIPFETSLFKGVAMIRIADLSTSPADYFAGKRRKMQVCVQGQFKKPLRYDQVFGGQEFSGGLRNIPGKWLIKWAFELLKPRLPKSFEADLFGPTPYFLSPLVLTAQKMRADEGEAQPVTDHEIQEEMGLILGEKYVGKNDDKGRKKAFSGAGALASTRFDTNLIYTFDYFQQFLRSDQFALDLGVKLLDLSHYLGEQPLLLTMAKDMESGEYLWKFELWHERCVPLDKSKPANQ